VPLAPDDARVGTNVHPLLAKDAIHLLDHVRIHPWKNRREQLDDGDLRAKPTPHRAELEPNDAAANDDEMLGHLRQA
jgi:hypothetical protein